MKFAKLSAIIVTFGSLISGHALGQAPIVEKKETTTAAKAGAKFSSDSEVGQLLDNPAAKAVLIKHIPAIAQDEQIEMARSMSLRSLQQYAPDDLSDQLLAKIDADLAQLSDNTLPAPGNKP